VNGGEPDFVAKFDELLLGEFFRRFSVRRLQFRGARKDAFERGSVEAGGGARSGKIA